MKIKLITAIILLCTLNIFAQPKSPDWNNERKIHNQLLESKSPEGKHYKEYLEKYREAGFPISEKGFCWEYRFYYYRINLDALDEFKDLGIDLVKLGNNEFMPFFDTNYLDDALFTNIIFVGEAVDSCAIGNLISPYRTKFTIKVTEVLKGKEYYKTFPDTINLYFSDHPAREDYEIKLNDPKRSEEMKKCYRYRMKKYPKEMISTGITSNDLRIKLGKKCLIYLEDAPLPKSVTGNDKTNNYHPGTNWWVDKKRKNGSSKTIEFIKRINELNKSEFNHSSRGK